jgi:toxin ParE1/3/4
MSYNIIFSPEAETQLIELYDYIVFHASSDIALRYTEAIVNYCESLSTFPHRGTKRDDIRSGLRITNYRKRVVIAFTIESELISILGIFYGGQNYEALLLGEDSNH